MGNGKSELGQIGIGEIGIGSRLRLKGRMTNRELFMLICDNGCSWQPSPNQQPGSAATIDKDEIMHTRWQRYLESARLGALGAGLGLAVSVASCAAPLGPVTIDGKLVPRQQLKFTGQPYSIQHIDAYPGTVGPSSGLNAEGGRITGVICGSDVEYSVQHAGDRIKLNGIVDNQHNAHLEITETSGFHTITGSVAYREINVQLFGDRLRGFIGRCPFDLTQEGDALVQTQYNQTVAAGNEMHLRINGVDALWKLPAADQAALLPMVVQCLQQKMFENMGHENPPAMGFGGAVGAVPPNTLRFGSTDNRSCGGSASFSSGRSTP